VFLFVVLVWIFKPQRYGFFGLSLAEKRQKATLCMEKHFFLKKIEKKLARNEICCTFAAAFGNE